MKKKLTKKASFQWQIRVYEEDTDATGVVYHANYLRFFTRARSEWLRNKLGLEHSQFTIEHGLLFAVRQIKIDYQKPARLDQLLRIKTKLLKVGYASLIMSQTAIDEAGQILCQAELKIAVINKNTFKPSKLPEYLIIELENNLSV